MRNIEHEELIGANNEKNHERPQESAEQISQPESEPLATITEAERSLVDRLKGHSKKIAKALLLITALSGCHGSKEAYHEARDEQATTETSSAIQESVAEYQIPPEIANAKSGEFIDRENYFITLRERHDPVTLNLKDHMKASMHDSYTTVLVDRDTFSKVEQDKNLDSSTIISGRVGQFGRVVDASTRVDSKTIKHEYVFRDQKGRETEVNKIVFNKAVNEARKKSDASLVAVPYEGGQRLVLQSKNEQAPTEEAKPLEHYFVRVKNEHPRYPALDGTFVIETTAQKYKSKSNTWGEQWHPKNITEGLKGPTNLNDTKGTIVERWSVKDDNLHFYTTTDGKIIIEAPNQ